jgi:hypothetical protein
MTMKLLSTKSLSALLGTCALGIIIFVGASAKTASGAEDTMPASEIAVEAAPGAHGAQTAETKYSRRHFEALLRARDDATIKQLLSEIESDWSPAYIPALLETATYASAFVTEREIFALLRRQTGQDIVADVNRWHEWWWNQPAVQTADYGNFKADLYRQIDQRFGRYFKDRQDSALIRLDEVRWGGVVQDGIPPLREPKMLGADDADYLNDNDVVFGIEINGDARAYPKRILAWHEMFVDTVGGVDIAGVYCTLCGTVIPYKTSFEGTNYTLGTSGFLYRSNKLMYDADTQSLWNTLLGEPVIGPLAGTGVKLEHLSVVTTSWGEWKRRHPQTQVLSLETGHRRDYGEGVAYQDYFATDRLMFNTPFADTRLKNKQEVLALRFAGAPGQQLAIDTDFLLQNPVYKDAIGLQRFIVLTDKTGANRVYDPANIDFTAYDGDRAVTDADGQVWQLSESALTAPDGTAIERLPYHRAFWFGWKAAFPDTRLVK